MKNTFCHFILSPVLLNLSEAFLSLKFVFFKIAVILKIMEVVGGETGF